ncbi:zinc ABC transporter substrate-binding protein [Brevibacillus laterosporus]|nr:metal ABC transporter substrate-binding protein [Brevibacillus laterosporus]RAP27224.1 hypothetical protein C2W64_01056 [Brevibacillus laterosporus]TPG70351.1 zinc ABC transporter substrate-binding protein [Brevibacillus laterosporus]TPG84310.1 zinc ABC transporter substrate-binding protein [Brevibacillus laterosporus]
MLRFVKSWGVILGIASMALFVSGCGNTNIASPVQESGKLSVYTTIYPLYYVADRIGGEYVSIKNVVPAGVEPHDYEPTAQDMVAISKANVLIYNGGGLEAWVEKAVKSLNQENLLAVNTTEGLTLLTSDEDEDDHHHEGETGHEGESAGHDHDHGEFDPHVWLDPTMLEKQAAQVKDAFVKADQAHKEQFEQNYKVLVDDLKKLDQDFKTMVGQSSKKEILVSHKAFTYLASRYGLEQIAISGVSPDDEPSPAELKNLVEKVKQKNIKYVMFETLASPKVAEVIARETKAQTAVLNPLEGLTTEEQTAGKDYISIMRDNLEVLRQALK